MNAARRILKDFHPAETFQGSDLQDATRSHQASEIKHTGIDEKESMVRTGMILRGYEAALAARPYQIQVPEFVADYPLEEELPEEVEASAEEKTAAPDPILLEVLQHQWEEEATARLAQAKEAALRKGFEEGYAAAQAELQVIREQETQALAQHLQQVDAMWQDFIEKIEPLMVTLSFDLAEQILEQPLPDTLKTACSESLAQSLKTLEKGNPVTVYLHPEVLESLQASGQIETLNASNSGLKWCANDDLTPGDWVIETPERVIRRLKDELFAQLKSRLGLLNTRNPSSS